MKKLIGLIISFVSIFSICFSADTSIDDCVVISIKDGSYINLNTEKYANILPAEAMTKIFDNLRAACCDKKINGVNCESLNSEIFPDSVYLFDHILDVYLRRLDAKQEDANWWDLIYGLQPDNLWQEWRTFISEIGNDSEWTPPTSINETYKRYWKWSVFTEKYSDRDVQINNSQWMNNIEKSAQNYQDWNLVDRYYNACNLIMMMYLNMAKPFTNRPSTLNTNQKQAKLKNIYTSCESLIRDRIFSERSYAEAIMQQKWTVFLDDTLNTYLNVYFLENKLSGLKDKMFNRWEMFKEVVKWVDKLVKNCS